MGASLFLSSQLQEIFRKKNEKKGRKGDAEKSAQLVRKEDEGVFLRYIFVKFSYFANYP